VRLVRADLGIDRLVLGDASLTEVDLGLGPSEDATGGDAWAVDLASRELAGRARIPLDRDRPVELALDRLDLQALSEDAAPTEARVVDSSRRALETTPPRLPKLDVRVDELRWGASVLGSLELELQPDVLGATLPTIRLFGGEILSAEGDAAWRDSGERGRSEVSMAVEVTDAGSLSRVASGQGWLQGAPLRATLALTWPGRFSDFELAGADGDIDVRVGPGRLLDVEPGAGRLLGVLNLGAVRRRLAMDFSDLYAQGFAFEEMRGRIELGAGRATLDGFTIEGPASRLIVSGASDLVKQRLDQTVLVEPRLSSGVALASAVAGGPLVGAAVFLVDRIAGNPIDRLGRHRYRVTGDWLNPEVIRVGWDPALGREASGAGSAGETEPSAPNHFLD
jgi:uncharacterized protein YhdP